MATDNRVRLVVCVDVEARGSSPIRHGMNALGLVAYAMLVSGPTLLEKKCWALARLPGQTFEPECLEGFWKGSSRKIELMHEFEEKAQPVEDVMREYYQLVARYAVSFNVVIVSDAPEYDMPFLAYYLDVCGFPPPVYMPRQDQIQRTPAMVSFAQDEAVVQEQAMQPPLQYASIPNVVSYANGVAQHSLAHKQLNKDGVVKDLGLDLPESLYDHEPSNDAEYIAKLFFATCARAPRDARAPKKTE